MHARGEQGSAWWSEQGAPPSEHLHPHRSAHSARHQSRRRWAHLPPPRPPSYAPFPCTAARDAGAGCCCPLPPLPMWWRLAAAACIAWPHGGGLQDREAGQAPESQERHATWRSMLVQPAEPDPPSHRRRARTLLSFPPVPPSALAMMAVTRVSSRSSPWKSDGKEGSGVEGARRSGGF